ncbi:hypothetical protein ABLE94_24115 [Gordonia sp. VNK1]|uniref:hypothetical protein n=1 Tax=Gordonia oleivorans TaxID=3156618 RepID=UPI0032B4A03D
MTAQSREDAVSIFTELGWPDLPYDRLATADIGTDDQRRRARDGLATGPLQVYDQDDSGVWTWISKVGHADLNRLSIFAIRVGVDARRAASIVPFEVPRAALLQVISDRGTAFATQFIGRVCTSSRRAMTHQPTVFADVALRLVLDLELPVPDNVDYLIDWAAYADAALHRSTAEFTRSGPTLVTADHIVARFAEHARAAVAVGAPMTGPLRPALAAGVSRGLIDRDEMLDLAVVGLDAARRPGDRAAWAQFLTTELAMSDSEIADRAEQWIPALATGTPEIIERLGLPLFTSGPDELLADLVAVTVPGVKARRLRTLIFDALAGRSRPDDATVAEVSAALAEVATSSADVKSLAALTQAWEMSVDVADAPSDVVAWSPTPEVWTVPRFDAGAATPDRLTESIRPLMDSAEHDFASVELERFLALAVTCASDDLEATRTAVRGVRDSERLGLAWISEWRQGQLPRKAYQPYGFTQARDYAVVCRLGEIPCVLSQPSWDDLRIDAADLLSRMTSYALHDVSASEEDLALALTRLDLATVTSELSTDLRASGVAVVDHRGKQNSRSAGEIVGAYVDEPIPEPAMVMQQGRWHPGNVHVPAALTDLYGRFGDRYSYSRKFWEFPTWGDAAMGSVGWDYEADPGQGEILRQLARRGSPLPPGASINMLGAQRDPHPRAAADAHQAVLDAFARGLLRPGVAEVRFLDSFETPQNVAAFARALKELADDGLLSVVWPILDDLAAVAAEATRVFSGTDVVVDTLAALLPSVRVAVAGGTAPADSLALPGVRKLAVRKGSGVAVAAARTVVGTLPEMITSPRPPEPAAPASRFGSYTVDDVWSPDIAPPAAIDDGATITVVWEEGATTTRRAMKVLLTYPQFPGSTFRMPTTWLYPLQHEGQASGVEHPIAEATARSAWLHWDADSERIIVSRWRDRESKTDSPPTKSSPPPPLTVSMVAIALSHLCNSYADTYAVWWMINFGRFGADSVRLAMRSMLTSPDVSPAKIAKVIDKSPDTLHTLWPVLTESVRAAGAMDGPTPRWLNGILDVSLGVASLLAEAHRRGLAPIETVTWPGLDAIAERKGRSAALVKARQLRDLRDRESGLG